MQSTLSSTGPIKRTLHVLVEPEDLKQEFDKQIKELANKAHLPGFRKGNVPTGLIRERYGKDILLEIKSKSVEESLNKAIEIHNIRLDHIAGFFQLSERDQPALEYFINLIVEPDVVVDKLDQLSVVRPVYEITERDIDKELESFIKRKSKFVEIDGPIEIGHYVYYQVVDLGSRIIDEDKDHDYKEILNDIYSAQVGYQWEEDSKNIQKIILEEMLGRSLDEKFVVNRDLVASVDHDEDSDSATEKVYTGSKERLSNERLHVEVLVEGIQKVVRPDLDEEFFSNLPEDEKVENLDELRSNLRFRLRERLDSSGDQLIRNQVMNQLVLMNPVDVPLVPEPGDEDEDEDEIESALEAERVRLIEKWIIGKYARENNIEVHSQEVNASLEVSYRIRKFLGQNTDVMHTSDFQKQVYMGLLTDRVLDDIIEKLEIEEKPTTVSDYYDFKVANELNAREPTGGPFHWTSPVSELEIRKGIKEVDALWYRYDGSGPLSEEKEGEKSSKDETGGKGGMFKRLLSFVGGKK